MKRSAEKPITAFWVARHVRLTAWAKEGGGLTYDVSEARKWAERSAAEAWIASEHDKYWPQRPVIYVIDVAASL